MDLIISELTDLVSQSNENEGRLADSFSVALDAFCNALAMTGRQTILPALAAGQVILGLLTVQEIANTIGTTGLEAGSGKWAYTLQPAPQGVKTLILKRDASQKADLYIQIDRNHLIYGLITLVQENEVNEEVFSFDLEKRQDGWYLRRWEENKHVSFHLGVPAGNPILWNTSPSYDFIEQLLPAGGIGIMEWVSSISPIHFLASKKPKTAEPEQVEQAPAAQPLQPPAVVAPVSKVHPNPPTSTSSPQTPMWRLGLQPGDKNIPLAGRLSIGRSVDNDLRLEDPQLSRHHAVIEKTITGWQISDLDSKNGIKINGKRITNPTMLNLGDVIELGDIRLTMEFR